MKELFKKITVGVFCLIIVSLMAAHILLPDRDISTSERRHLASLPSFSANSLMSGTYMQNMEKYLSDQFPLRETFRSVGSISELTFGRLDVNDIYSHNGYLATLDYEYDENAVKKSADKLNYAAETLGGKYYTALIPAKDYYINDSVHPVLDYDALRESFNDSSDGVSIDISSKLTLGDYYKSDSHWRQEKITAIARDIVEEMGYAAPEISYTENRLNGFRGVYAGQSAVWQKSEDIVYLTWEGYDKIKVKAIGGECDALYTVEKAKTSVDMYDVFLGGAVPLIFIENENAVNDATLFVFRDSYGSSMAPLLSAYFKNIVVIDFRYVTLDNAVKLCNEYSPDATLAMLSCGVVKNGEMLKINVK